MKKLFKIGDRVSWWVLAACQTAAKKTGTIIKIQPTGYVEIKLDHTGNTDTACLSWLTKLVKKPRKTIWVQSSVALEHEPNRWCDTIVPFAAENGAIFQVRLCPEFWEKYEKCRE